MRHRGIISVFAALYPAVLAVSACSPAGPNNKATSLADAAKGSERISARHFGRQTVPCREPDATARALLELTSRDLADDTRTRLLDHESDRVQLNDGPGQIVVIVYSIAEGDDEAVITTTEHFLVNQACQVLHWSSASNANG